MELKHRTLAKDFHITSQGSLAALDQATFQSAKVLEQNKQTLRVYKKTFCVSKLISIFNMNHSQNYFAHTM